MTGGAPRRDHLLRRVGRLEQYAGVRAVTLADGAERGVRVLEFRSGHGFNFDVLVDRCLDIGRAELRSRALAWLSPAGLSSPWAAENRGLSWFRSWSGGLLTTCGLDHTLLGGSDVADQYHQEVVTSVDYPLHGRVGALPARLTGYGETWDDDGLLLWAEGTVRQAAVFGECLELRRRIELRAGTARVRVTDEVVNAGFDRTSHMYLYHVNVGWPVVDEGSRLVLPAGPGRPTGTWHQDGPLGYRHLTGPQRGFSEQCYEHSMVPGPDGTTSAAVINDAIALGVYQRYDATNLPFHTVWRMLGEGTYAVALEPTTNRDAGRFDAIERGELRWLEPGERCAYTLEIGALDGPEEINDFDRGIATVWPPIPAGGAAALADGPGTAPPPSVPAVPAVPD